MTVEHEAAIREIAAIQELYDATTLLQAALTFTHETADLLKPELDYACRRLIAARAAMRRLLLVNDTAAGVLDMPELPPPFNKSALRPTPARAEGERS